MKREVVPAKDRFYHPMFGRGKISPSLWSSYSKTLLYGYDQKQKSRLIDLTRISEQLLAELKQTIPVYEGGNKNGVTK